LAALAASAACALPAAAQAQAKVARVGILSGWSATTESTGALRQALQRLGYVEGRTIAYEERYAEGRTERLAGLAAELVQRRVDVIVVGNVQAARSALQASAATPIVVAGGDAIGTGLVRNLAQPGGNLTGVATIATELTSKRLKLLKDAVPRIRRVAVLALEGNPNSRPALEHARQAAGQLGLAMHPAVVRDMVELEAVFAGLKKAEVEGLLVVPSAVFRLEQQRILRLAGSMRLPSIWEWREAALDGALISYGADNAALWERAGGYVDRILKGAKPGDLPMEQPTKFDLVINAKTAKTFGIAIPGAVMVMADEVLR
jgi:putative tryptophan/tyrosine transport system substrate-binding protein